MGCAAHVEVRVACAQLSVASVATAEQTLVRVRVRVRVGVRVRVRVRVSSVASVAAARGGATFTCSMLIDATAGCISKCIGPLGCSW